MGHTYYVLTDLAEGRKGLNKVRTLCYLNFHL